MATSSWPTWRRRRRRRPSLCGNSIRRRSRSRSSARRVDSDFGRSRGESATMMAPACTAPSFIYRHTSIMYTELNRAAIATLVNDFYTDIRRDSVLQPVFDGAIGANWEPHLERMVDFWCSVMLSSGEFKGNVYGKHMALQGIELEH